MSFVFLYLLCNCCVRRQSRLRLKFCSWRFLQELDELGHALRGSLMENLSWVRYRWRGSLLVVPPSRQFLYVLVDVSFYERSCLRNCKRDVVAKRQLRCGRQRWRGSWRIIVSGFIVRISFHAFLIYGGGFVNSFSTIWRATGTSPCFRQRLVVTYEWLVCGFEVPIADLSVCFTFPLSLATCWEWHGTPFCSVVKIPRIQWSIKDMPSSIP